MLLSPRLCSLWGGRVGAERGDEALTRAALFIAVTTLGVAGCGRTPLDADLRAGTRTGPCDTDEDCVLDACNLGVCRDQRCVPAPPRDCDDGDACTLDACDPSTGRCLSAPRTRDLDGDGYRAPLPGARASAPGACGEDCDDSSAAAFPGGAEVCDGVDNDCNGSIDDGATLLVGRAAPVRVSPEGALEATPAALVWNGESFGALLSVQTERWQAMYQSLDAEGTRLAEPQNITGVTSDTFGTSLVWTGSLHGVAWEDRRDGDYEVYANLLDRSGAKLGPDLRASHVDGFSLDPELAWLGDDGFMLAWGEDPGLGFGLQGLRLSPEGSPSGNAVALTEPNLEAESPELAVGVGGVGLAFKMELGGVPGVGFQTLTRDLSERTPRLLLSSGNAVGPALAWAGDRYVVAWSTREGDTPGRAIWGAAITEQGELIVPERELTDGAQFARAPALLSYGDRVFLVYTADAGDGYDLYAKVLDLSLAALTPSLRLTRDAADTSAPVPARAPDGGVGILFWDELEGSRQTYFVRLRCAGAG